MKAKDIIFNYAEGRLSSLPQATMGRGNNLADLNSEILEKIYQGIKIEISEAAAEAFVNIVGDMVDDASATTFLLSLFALEKANWVYNKNIVKQGAENDAEAALHAAKKEGGAFVMSVSGYFGSLNTLNHLDFPGAGTVITGAFLEQHKQELYQIKPLVSVDVRQKKNFRV